MKIKKKIKLLSATYTLFFSFKRKSVDISYELSNKKTVHMKCQDYLTPTQKKSNFRLLQFFMPLKGLILQWGEITELVHKSPDFNLLFFARQFHA